ncbi:MAG: protein kinase [Nitrosomonadales bacterium]|nr:protein kinase [Nitrosomonadales bacterium]
MISNLGRYEIIEELARGAMGIVYKARDPLIDRLVAVKTINLQILPPAEKAEYAARFYQEAKAAGHLNHRNIVTIHDLGESEDVAYIAMELMEGRELKVAMDGMRRLSTEEVLNIAIQVADGLFHAHQRGIVHRDIKPSNIMLVGDEHVKIADFGIAQMSTSLSITQNGKITGSPLYMSPEQVLGKKVDARSDIFSLGIVLYQMLTGQLPFSGTDANSVMYQIVSEQPPQPGSFNPDVTEMLDALVMKCLAKKPEDRYANARKLADDLRSCHQKLLRAKAVIDHPLISTTRFNHLQQLATPGAISPIFVAAASYAAMGLICAIDVISHTRIQMHMLYIFPLILVSFHCEQIRWVNMAIILSLSLQAILLATDIDLSMSATFVLGTVVLLSNIMVAYVARIARANFLEVGNLVSHDKLTGLRNRLSFENMVDMEIERQKEYGGMFSFAHIDIDKLKDLNATKGFAAGDEAVKLVANAIREHVRSFDIAARLGGDEFAILMPNTGENDCISLCNELSMRILDRMKNADLPVSATIGYVTFEQAPTSMSEVLHKAETAMLEAQVCAVNFNPYRGGMGSPTMPG